MVDIRPCMISEIEQAANFAALLAEYAAESSIAGLPHPSAQMPMYHTLEAAGALVCFGAFQDGELLGFVLVLTHIMPHYGVGISTTESYFVASAHRKTGAGILLRHAAERHAQQRGSAGILISAPHGGRLAEVLTHSGYRQTNDVFFKGFN